MSEKRNRYFYAEISAHSSDYMAYFRKNDDMIFDYQPIRWDYYEICKMHEEGVHFV